MPVARARFAKVVLAASAAAGCAGCARQPEKNHMSIASVNGPKKPVDARTSAIVHEYISDHQKWPRDAYYLEDTARVDEHGDAIINVVYKGDKNPMPLQAGGGMSLQVHVSTKQGKVTQVFHFQ